MTIESPFLKGGRAGKLAAVRQSSGTMWSVRDKKKSVFFAFFAISAVSPPDFVPALATRQLAARDSDPKDKWYLHNSVDAVEVAG
jgi:hypothetical protein